MTSKERFRVSQKRYESISKKDLIEAARQVFVLMDQNDIKFENTTNGFIASRKWFMYKIIHASCGTDFWNFQVVEEGDKLIASIRPSVRYGLIDSDQKGALIQGTAIYQMFWKRLDFLLGRSLEWESCEMGLKKIKSMKTCGSLEHICDSLTLDDATPDSDIDSKVANNKK